MVDAGGEELLGLLQKCRAESGVGAAELEQAGKGERKLGSMAVETGRIDLESINGALAGQAAGVPKEGSGERGKMVVVSSERLEEVVG